MAEKNNGNVWLDIGSAAFNALGSANIPYVSPVANALGGFLGKTSAKQQHQQDLEWQADQAQINRDFQREERLATQDFNVDMWNANNEYNSLSSQVQRALDAGVNPNAIVGDSSVPARAVESSPMPGATASATSSLASSLLTSDATVKNLLAQAEKSESEADNNKYSLSWNKMTEEQRYQALVKGNSKTDAEIEKIISESGYTDNKKDIETKMFEWYSKLSEQDIKLKEEQLNKLRNENSELLAKVRLIDKQIVLADKEGKFKDMQSLSTQQGIYESMHKISLMNEQEEGYQLDNELKKVQKAFSDVTGLPLNTPEFLVNFYLYAKGNMWSMYNNIAIKGIESVVDGVGNAVGNVVPYNAPSYGNSQGKTPSVLNPTGPAQKPTR